MLPAKLKTIGIEEGSVLAHGDVLTWDENRQAIVTRPPPVLLVANDVALASTVPGYIGQLALTADNHVAYVATGSSAGDWAAVLATASP